MVTSWASVIQYSDHAKRPIGFQSDNDKQWITSTSSMKSVQTVYRYPFSNQDFQLVIFMLNLVTNKFINKKYSILSGKNKTNV